MISDGDKLRFKEACLKVLGTDYSDGGIGTQKEKAMHRILKLYIEPDESLHEIKYLGYIADIRNDMGIYEIQTRSVEKLIPKLERFLPKSSVTVVLPVITDKTVRWVDRKTRELSEPRKSPKHENPFFAMRDIYKLRKFIQEDNLTFRLILIKAEDYRYIRGNNKRDSEQLERIPTELVGDITLSTSSDYIELLPNYMPEEFTSRALADILKIPSGYSSEVVGTLKRAGAVYPVGKVGRAFLYKKRN